jgi:hypothetical protein
VSFSLHDLSLSLSLLCVCNESSSLDSIWSSTWTWIHHVIHVWTRTRIAY